MHGIRHPAAVSRRTYRAILGFHTQMRLSLSFRHSNPGRQYETIQGSVAPIYLPTFLPSFLPEMKIAWTAPGEDQAHPSIISFSRFRGFEADLRASSFESRRLD